MGERNKKYLLYSMTISIVGHLLLAGGTSLISIPPMISPQETIPRKFQVRLSSKEMKTIERVREKDKPLVERVEETLKFQAPEMNSEDLAALESPEKKNHSQYLNPEVEQSFLPVDIPKEIPLTRLENYEKDSSLLKKTEQRVAQMHTVQAVPSSGGGLLVSPKELIASQDLEQNFIDQMPGYTPQLIERALDATEGRGRLGVGRQEDSSILKRKIEHEDLGDLLVYQLLTYQDPVTEEKYFKIAINAEASIEKLSVIPKEVIFLIDCSLSIDQRRLEQFKDGIAYTLNNLNSEDRFNIWAFREDIIRFKSVPVLKSSPHIREAMRFIDELKIGNKTDAYNALLRSIKAEEARLPSYIFFLSDGRPTKGVTSPRELINKISEINAGRISIFAFSGGVNVNRYLLDFIAYKNRGWAEYSYRTNFIGQNLSNMYQKIRYPIMLNLRYRISGVQEEDVFPKIMPDLFKNAELNFYGRYEDERNFVLQFLGDFENETKEFLIETDFSTAAQGDDTIARNWAFNKLYHLIGLLKDNQDNQDLIEEINALVQKFDLKAPYLKDILK